MSDIQEILKGERPISRMPTAHMGLILGEKRRGFFSVIEPTPESINYVENCMFMSGNHPYKNIGEGTPLSASYKYTLVNSILDITNNNVPECYPMHGGWARISPVDGDDAGLYQEISLLSGQYTFSAFVAGSKSHKFSVYVTDDSGNLITTKKENNGNNNWQRLHITFEAKTDSDYRMYLIRNKTETLPLTTFYTSFWVCEDNGFLTTPFNGNYTEFNNIGSEEYQWISAAVDTLGQSSRSGKSFNSGRETYLRDCNFVLTEIIGLGSSGIKHTVYPLASGGSVWNATSVTSREFVLRGVIYAKDIEERMKKEAELDDLLTSTAKKSIDQPTTLLFRVLNTEDNTIVEGQTLYIYCRYNGGISQDIPNDVGAYDVTLSFTLVDPYIYSSMHKGFYLDDKVTFTSTGYHTVITKDEENKFTQENITPNEKINKIVRGANGKIYIGGAFTSINSVANSKYIVEYDDKTGAVTSIAEFTDNAASLGNFVSDIIPMANGDLIVAGSWDEVDSIADSHNIARYSPATGDWSILGVGATDPLLLFYSIAIDQNLNIYGTGVQDSAGTNYVYKFSISDDAWSTIGELEPGGEITASYVYGKKILVINKKLDPDFVVADLYITGAFYQIDSVTDSGGLAKYDGQLEAWEALSDQMISMVEDDLATEADDPLNTEDSDTIVVLVSGGFAEDMAVGKDGKIYIVGYFSQTEGGLVSPYVIRYNGKQFEAIGLPGSYATFSSGAKSVIVDDMNRVHILMDFSFVDSIPLAKDYLVLTGNTWGTNGLFTDPTNLRVFSDGTLYWDSERKKMWIASRPYSGKVTYGGATMPSENNGEQVFPNLSFVGGGQLISLYNKATGKNIDFSGYTLQDSEIVTLKLEKHGLEIVKLISNLNGNISNMISPSSNINFNLVRGDNEIGHIFYNEDTDATCLIRWRERYLGIYNAIHFRNIV